MVGLITITPFQDTDREKLSELRQLLAKNLISPGNSSSGAFKRTSLPLRDTKMETVISSATVVESADQVTNTSITVRFTVTTA